MNIRAQSADTAGMLSRQRLTVTGQVQGVGFRPHALRCAAELGLSGWVVNHGDGVTIEVEGRQVAQFEALLRAKLPPLARIDTLHAIGIAPIAERGFSVRRSEVNHGNAVVPPDVAICPACIEELFDRYERRYLHPFIACADCGPRYSMARRLPYDRQTTAMAAFPLCSECSRDYREPTSRRLHAEPIACHHCGPTLSHPIDEIAEAIAAGNIVALKGIGGYHLVCDGRNAATIARLRERKRRDFRPFAVMMLNAVSVDAQAVVSQDARSRLEDPSRPVVVLDRAAGFDLPDELAPGLASLGVLLPYTAVHYLLFHALQGFPKGHAWLNDRSDITLLMTSANISGEPMLVDDAQAASSLAGIADVLVSHTRDIVHGCDDSVVRSAEDRTVMIRRGRGYAPAAFALTGTDCAVMALGAQLKNTVCVTRANQAFMSPHIGDLDSPAVRRQLDKSARELCAWLDVEPAAVACDLHPDYASTRMAELLSDELQLPLIRVQHHHAHIEAVVAAARYEGPVLGVALDGHGYGLDGSSWGGELLRVAGGRFERVGQLRTLLAPGGDVAAREPWRLAIALCEELNRRGDWAVPSRHGVRADAVRRLAASSLCCRTSACGRYFDTAAALLGICSVSSFEAEAPMRLEAHCHRLRSDSGLYRIDNGELDLHPLFERLLDCRTPQEGAELFHGTLIDALSSWILQSSHESGLETVALGGGCFLNAHLARELPRRLRARGLTVLTEWQLLPPGDGAISLGQASVARHLVGAGVHCEHQLRGNT